MLRVLKNILPFASQKTPRGRRHQFAPSVTESAANLEGRTMLSGAAGAAIAHAAVHHAAIHHGADHHAMPRHTAVHHHAPIHHAVAHHATAVRPGVMKREMRIEAQRQAAAAITAAAVAHDPVITSANSGSGFAGADISSIMGGFPAGNISGGTVSGTVVPGVTSGPNGSTNYGGGSLTSSTYNGYSSVTGGLPAALQNSYLIDTGLGVPQPQVVSQFAANSGINRGYQVSPYTTSTTGLTATNSTALASELANLLGTTGMTTSTGRNSALGSEVADLLANLGLTRTGFTTGTGTGTLAESPLASLLLGGQIPTAGTTTTDTLTTGVNGSFGQLFPTLFHIDTPVNPSPLPLNGVLPFTRSPINPSPLPYNGVLT